MKLMHQCLRAQSDTYQITFNKTLLRGMRCIEELSNQAFLLQQGYCLAAEEERHWSHHKPGKGRR